jgi:hypothetical protein
MSGGYLSSVNAGSCAAGAGKGIPGASAVDGGVHVALQAGEMSRRTEFCDMQLTVVDLSTDSYTAVRAQQLGKVKAWYHRYVPLICTSLTW